MPHLHKPSVQRRPPHNHPPSQTHLSAARPPTAVPHSPPRHATMAPPAVNTLLGDWFDHLPSTYRSLYLARRGGGGFPDGQPAGAPPRWLHVATRGPALRTGDLPRVHAEHPPSNRLPAARPAAATTPSTTNTDAHRTRLMQLEVLASMKPVVLARAVAQDVISKENAVKAGPPFAALRKTTSRSLPAAGTVAPSAALTTSRFPSALPATSAVPVRPALRASTSSRAASVASTPRTRSSSPSSSARLSLITSLLAAPFVARARATSPRQLPTSRRPARRWPALSGAGRRAPCSRAPSGIATRLRHAR